VPADEQRRIAAILARATAEIEGGDQAQTKDTSEGGDNSGGEPV
jgi:hypothetical protein